MAFPVEVTFDIADNVSMSVPRTRQQEEQQIKIQASGGLSDDDIEKMVQDAEANAEEDKLRKEKIRHAIRRVTHSRRGKNLVDLDDKVDDDLKTATTDAIAALRTPLDDDEDNDAA